MSTKPITLIDAFSSTAFSGNPAGVCVMDAFPDQKWMQAVAIEMNQAETAFLVPERDGFRLRWFTPGGEVDLCGHATLASAHHLWESGRLSRSAKASFYTLSGLLTATLVGEWIELDFPAEIVVPVEPPDGLEQMLGCKPVFIGKNRLDYLVELSSEVEVRELRPDLREIARLPSRGLIVTAKGAGEADIVSRCFYPALGVNEDPVTGSAHCGLAPYWIPRLEKSELLAYQASTRGGWLRIRQSGDRVLLRGQAVTTLRGSICSSL